MRVDLLQMFFDTSNRPKRTPLHESVIEVRLEEKYPPWKIIYGLQNLQEEGLLDVILHEVKKVGFVKFYFPSKLKSNASEKNKIIEKIEKSSKLIQRYANEKMVKTLGAHLHSLVKAELRANEFQIINIKDTNEYDGILWKKSEHKLDIIAKHKKNNLKIGVEVKNSLDIPDNYEIMQKINICKHLKIIPIFACRWMMPYKDKIEFNGGFLWQFKNQAYPLGQENLVQQIRNRFGFPVEVQTELSMESANMIREWLIKMTS